MAHAQKTDSVFRRNGRVYLNRQVASVHSNIGSRVVRIRGINAGYNMIRGSVKSTHSIRQFPLHFPTRASRCAITFQLDSIKPSTKHAPNSSQLRLHNTLPSFRLHFYIFFLTFCGLCIYLFNKDQKDSLFFSLYCK
jgi:hypothetical protein